jgi:hypothetical protein
MKRLELLLISLLGYLVTAAGVVWKFGEYGLMGSGVVLMFLASFVKVRDD